MAQATLTRILEAIETLEAEELRRVEEVVRGLLEPLSKEAEREEVLRVLHESGLVKDLKRPSMTRSRERPLIPIKGKPLSETIIEERR